MNFLGKGMLIHTNDLVNEMEYMKSKRNGTIPGKIVIDGNAHVGTDLHAAFESYMGMKTQTGAGSTASGISQGFADYVLKDGAFM